MSLCTGIRWFFFDSIAILGPAKASAFQVSNPLFTPLISWMFFGEKVTWLHVLFIFVVIFELLLISYNPSLFSKRQVATTSEPLELHLTTKQKRRLVGKELLKSGVFLAFFSTLSYAVGNVLRGTGIQHWNEPILGGLIGAAMGLILHFSINTSSRNIKKQLKNLDLRGMVYYAISGVLTISGQILVIASMRFIPVSITTLITVSTPILVTPLSYFLLKNEEGINRFTILGGVLVLIGISIIVLL